MKLHRDPVDGLRITARGSGWIKIGEKRYEGPVWIDKQNCKLLDQPIAKLEDFTTQIIKEVIAARPEIVLFGSGRVFAFAPVDIRAELSDAGIGVEAMDTAAACRTFNILVAEGRDVVALLTHG